ncbi:hypothetical protein [Diaminobutyricibacter sp. McL0608]
MSTSQAGVAKVSAWAPLAIPAFRVLWFGDYLERLVARDPA